MTSDAPAPRTDTRSSSASPPRVTIATWNLQGSHGLDVDAVAAILDATQADVIALQEIQRHQARRLSERLAMTAGSWWVFKHWPIVSRPEGLAVLTPHQMLASRRVVVRHHAWWSWRRRVVAIARVRTPSGDVEVADVHLSPHEQVERRHREARTVLAVLAGGAPTFVAGDLNDTPGDGAHRVFTEAGLRDAWAAVAGSGSGSGATNWSPGDRRGRDPTQRIDFVFLPGDWCPQSVNVGAGAPIEHVAELSDHLPVVVTAGRQQETR